MKGEFSMQSVKTLFKLDLLSRFGSTHKRGVKYRIMQYSNYLFFVAIYALLVYGIYYLTRMFVKDGGLKIEFQTIAITITMVIATAISTGAVIKNLYQNGDNEMLLRFPVSGKEILVAKTIYCFLHNLIVCALLMLPFFISFGAVTNARVGDYFSYFAVTLLSSFLPFFIANIIAVPVMKLMNLVKNQFLLVLIITILAVCGIFIFYLTSLSTFLNYLRREGETLLSSGTIQHFRQFANAAYPFRFYAELINGRLYSGLSSGHLALRFFYILLITAALGVIAYFVTTKEYYKTILYGIETEKASFHKNITDKQRRPAWALFRREFYLILRSFNYSFQYFAMACAAPVMVFFCNRLAATMGTQTVGAKIMPGITLMVIVIFITIIVSFASTCISREGNCFYHTKIIPVSYMTQTLVKFGLYAAVASVSVALCCMVSGIYYTTDAGGHALSALDVGAIFGISEILVIAMTSLFMLIDIKSPTFNVGGDGELVAANKNVALAVIVGIFIAVLYGVLIMLLSFVPVSIGKWQITTFMGGLGNVYLILALISLVLLGASLSALFVNLNKKYHNIIP
ncbi:MAG: hypothetical protein K2J16_02750 [Clostridia bacterium]|nr:hypothetical protein [Clostridia bacterium]